MADPLGLHQGVGDQDLWSKGRLNIGRPIECVEGFGAPAHRGTEGSPTPVVREAVPVPSGNGMLTGMHN